MARRHAQRRRSASSPSSPTPSSANTGPACAPLDGGVKPTPVQDARGRARADHERRVRQRWARSGGGSAYCLSGRTTSRRNLTTATRSASWTWESDALESAEGGPRRAADGHPGRVRRQRAVPGATHAGYPGRSRPGGSGERRRLAAVARCPPRPSAVAAGLVTAPTRPARRACRSPRRGVLCRAAVETSNGWQPGKPTSTSEFRTRQAALMTGEFEKWQ